MTAYHNLCRWNAVSAGAGTFTVGTADAGCFTPAQKGSVDSKTYYYMAKAGLQWESGHGVLSSGGTILTRVVDNYSSRHGDVSPVNFATPPLVDVFPSPGNLEADFPSGTRMTFQQTTAPVGWVKDTTQNDKALRLVSGTVSTGGVNSFSSSFTTRTSDGHTLIVSELASHNHPQLYNPVAAITSIGYSVGSDYGQDNTARNTSNQNGGGDNPHTHTYDMRVQYVDFIIAQKS